jgi:carbon-monoxide dehydrogenase large subunit
MMVGGSAIAQACEKVIAKGRRFAGFLLQLDPASVVFEQGVFRGAQAGGSVTMAQVVQAAFSVASLPAGLEGGLDVLATFAPPAPTYPNSCHACEVEIDPATGAVWIARYVVVDDVGVVLDHPSVEGQVQGGVAQGIGQCLGECAQYDEAGQLLTGSFMDYAMPRADDVPYCELTANGTPTANNPLGAKGAGEAGTIGAIPAVMNGIIDALSPLGITHLDMPASPQRIWQAIQTARQTHDE